MYNQRTKHTALKQKNFRVADNPKTFPRSRTVKSGSQNESSVTGFSDPLFVFYRCAIIYTVGASRLFLPNPDCTVRAKSLQQESNRETPSHRGI